MEVQCGIWFYGNKIYMNNKAYAINMLKIIQIAVNNNNNRYN